MRRTLPAPSSRELPATEMAVSPFHHAGVSSKNVTSSVPHLKEIIDVATSIETPSLSLYLEPEIAPDPMLAKNAARSYVAVGRDSCRGDIV